VGVDGVGWGSAYSGGVFDVGYSGGGGLWGCCNGFSKVVAFLTLKTRLVGGSGMSVAYL